MFASSFTSWHAVMASAALAKFMQEVHLLARAFQLTWDHA